MSSSSSVHPRARGERSLALAAAIPADGSSPRARGTGPEVAQRLVDGRFIPFIPARAGNGLEEWMSISGIDLHPRARGERGVVLCTVRLAGGSSPRARGTDALAEGGRQIQRFIPARAGNGRPRGPRARTPSVHPRARGERMNFWASFKVSVGSSPRARGTDPVRIAAPQMRRFIPARAGNGVRPARAGPPAPVHPRARGERIGSASVQMLSVGSSPRARGTGTDAVSPWPAWRFIPARAGNGEAFPNRPVGEPVHPRARGERAPRRAVHEGRIGSSPRARGTGRRRRRRHRRRRFIPARAGNGSVRS